MVYTAVWGWGSRSDMVWMRALGMFHEDLASRIGEAYVELFEDPQSPTEASDWATKLDLR